MKIKNIVSALACASIVVFPVLALAAKGGIKGPAIQAYEHANDNASFKSGVGKGNNKGNDKLKKIDKELEKELDKSDKDKAWEGKDKNNKDTQLEK